VHDAERLVALGKRADDHAESEDVGQLLETDRFALHLPPDRVGALAPPRYLGVDAAIEQLASELLLDFGDQANIFRLERIEAFADHLVGFGIELVERQILELLPHLVHAHAARERSVDIKRFLGAAAPRLGRHVGQGAHVVQAVGELDQQHPYVVGDRQQELAQVLRLLRLLGHEVELLKLGQSFDQGSDVLAEHLVDLRPSSGGILDGVVQKGRGDGGVVELEIGQDRSDFQRMGEVRVAGRPLLLAVRLHGVHVGAIEQRLAGGGIVALHALDQVVLPHHWRL
jgi:hypothetical protein